MGSSEISFAPAHVLACVCVCVCGCRYSLKQIKANSRRLGFDIEFSSSFIR